MHYFGTMSQLRPWSDWKMMLAATVLLVAAWNVPMLGVLIIPAFVVLLELAHRPGRKFLKLYAVMALWNAATTYWIANAHPLGVIATVFINGALMAAALWLGVRSSILWRKFPQVERFSLLAYLPVVASWIAFEKLHDHWGLAFPWLNLGNTFNGLPILVQWYQWLGATGGTLWVLLVAIATYLEWLRRTVEKGSSALVVFSTCFDQYKSVVLTTFSKPSGWVSVAVVQPNINAYTEKWEMPEGEQIEKVRGLLHLIRRSASGFDCTAGDVLAESSSGVDLRVFADGPQVAPGVGYLW
jgi:apolipoprotein N-acyltransferase